MAAAGLAIVDEARGQVRQELEDLLKCRAFVDATRGPDAEPENRHLTVPHAGVGG